TADLRRSDETDDLARRHTIADATHADEDAVGGRAQHAIRAVALDGRGNAGVRLGLAVEDHAAEAMPAIRFDDRVHVDAGTEPRTEADDDGRVVERRSGVALGDDRVDDGDRAQPAHDVRLRIDDDGDVARTRDHERVVRGRAEACADALHDGRAVED